MAVLDETSREHCLVKENIFVLVVLVLIFVVYTEEERN